MRMTSLSKVIELLLFSLFLLSLFASSAVVGPKTETESKSKTDSDSSTNATSSSDSIQKGKAKNKVSREKRESKISAPVLDLSLGTRVQPFWNIETGIFRSNQLPRSDTNRLDGFEWERTRWIVFKYGNLTQFLEKTVNPILDRDNKERPPRLGNPPSKIQMEFLFPRSNAVQAFSFDASAIGAAEVSKSWKQAPNELMIPSVKFMHAHEMLGSLGNLYIDNTNQPPPSLEPSHQFNDPFPHLKRYPLKECQAKPKHSNLGQDDWGVRALINQDELYRKKIPKQPFAVRSKKTRIFIIGLGMDQDATNAPMLENVKIHNGYQVTSDRFAKLQQSSTPLGSSDYSNLGTYQAQVIGSIAPHAELIPIRLPLDELESDIILRAFEFVMESAKENATMFRTLCIFSGKLKDGTIGAYRLFTQKIGQLLSQESIFMTYGIDENMEEELLSRRQRIERRSQSKKDAKVEEEQYYHVGWYPHVLGVMALNRDLQPTQLQNEVYDDLNQRPNHHIVFSPSATVLVPNKRWIDGKYVLQYQSTYCYVDNAIAAATVAAVLSNYLSSMVFDSVRDPGYFFDIVVHRSRFLEGTNRTLISQVTDFCSVVDELTYDALAGDYICTPKRDPVDIASPFNSKTKTTVPNLSENDIEKEMYKFAM